MDERGRKLFAMMWTDQPGERAAACHAFVSHCKRIGLHPADAFNTGDNARYEAIIAGLRCTIDRNAKKLDEYKTLAGRAAHSVAVAEAEIKRLAGISEHLRRENATLKAAQRAVESRVLSRSVQEVARRKTSRSRSAVAVRTRAMSAVRSPVLYGATTAAAILLIGCAVSPWLAGLLCIPMAVYLVLKGVIALLESAVARLRGTRRAARG